VLLLGEGKDVVFVGTEMLNFAQTDAKRDSKAERRLSVQVRLVQELPDMHSRKIISESDPTTRLPPRTKLGFAAQPHLSEF